MKCPRENAKLHACEKEKDTDTDGNRGKVLRPLCFLDPRRDKLEQTRGDEDG